MSTSLTTVTPLYVDTGLDTIAPVKPSYIKFLQLSTSDLKGGQAGQFLDEMSGDLYDSFVVVPLRVVTNRVYYPPGAAFSTGVQPLCKSEDGIVPSPYIDTPQSANCKTCPNSIWKDGRPSPCSTKLKMLVILKETGMPRFVVASGTSVSPLRNMLRRINENMQVANLKQPDKPTHLYDYFFTIGSQKNKNYYVMTFTEVKRVANPGEFGFLYEKFVDSFTRAAEDEADTTIEADIVHEI